MDVLDEIVKALEIALEAMERSSHKMRTREPYLKAIGCIEGYQSAIKIVRHAQNRINAPQSHNSADFES